MIKKYFSLLTAFSLIFAAYPAAAVQSDADKPAGRGLSLPSAAVEVAPGLFKLGNAFDKQSGKMVEGYAIVHYKKNAAKPGGSGSNKTVCYGFLAKGAKWKSAEDWIVNSASGTVDSLYMLNRMAGDMSKWEQAAGGRRIFGNGTLVDSDLSASFGTLDGTNSSYFAQLVDGNTIALAYVWGNFSGPEAHRSLVEWDIVFNNSYDWSASGEATKMDFEDISTHELGHAVGMADLYTSSCTLETMYGYASAGEIIKRDLNAGDIAGVRTLYR